MPLTLRASSAFRRNSPNIENGFRRSWRKSENNEVTQGQLQKRNSAKAIDWERPQFKREFLLPSEDKLWRQFYLCLTDVSSLEKDHNCLWTKTYCSETEL